MDRHNPYSEVFETLSEVLATKAIPLGGPARLSYAAYRLRQIGDRERELLCGQASVALLCLEHAIRDHDPARRRQMIERVETIFEQWATIPLAEAGLFEPRALAA